MRMVTVQRHIGKLCGVPIEVPEGLPVVSDTSRSWVDPNSDLSWIELGSVRNDAREHRVYVNPLCVGPYQ